MSGPSDWNDVPSTWDAYEVDLQPTQPTPAAPTQPAHVHHQHHQHTGYGGNQSNEYAPRQSQSVRDESNYSRSDHRRDDRGGGGDVRRERSYDNRDRYDHRRADDRGGYDNRRSDDRGGYGGGGRDHRSYNNHRGPRDDRERSTDDGQGHQGGYENRPPRRDHNREPRERREYQHRRDDRGDGGYANGGAEERTDGRYQRDHHHQQHRRHSSAERGFNGGAAAATAAPSEPTNEEDTSEAQTDEADPAVESEEEDDSCPLCMETLDATDKQFKPCKCGYQVCLWCFPAGTPITLASGATVPIERVAKGELVQSYCIAEEGESDVEGSTSGVVLARSLRVIPRGEKQVLTLLLEDGRKVQCTPDHRLLVSNDKTGERRWKAAEEIDLECERVRVTVGKEETASELVELNAWSFTSTAAASIPPFSFPSASDAASDDVIRSRAMALARVAGCAWSRNNEQLVQMSSVYDALAFQADLDLITGDSCRARHASSPASSSAVAIPSAVSTLLATELGSFMRSTVPSAIRREFVAAALPARIETPSEVDFALRFHLSPTESDFLRALCPELHLLFAQPGLAQPHDVVSFTSAFGLRYSHTLASKLAVFCSWQRSSSANKVESFTAFITRVEAQAIFASPLASTCEKDTSVAARPTFSLRIIQRDLPTASSPLVPVYDLSILSSSSPKSTLSASIHSFTASSIVSHNCFHHINERLNGNCPACRRQYDTTGQMAADPAVLQTIAAKEKGKKGTSAPATATESGTSGLSRTSSTAGARKASSGNVPLAQVRVLQRNLLYVVGLPLSVAKDELLRSRPYFGKFGKIVKLALGVGQGGLGGKNTSSRGNSSANEEGRTVKQTCSCYVTYKRGVDAVEAIKAVNGCILFGCLIKATYGTSKYCANWLRQAPCNNPSCLYLHEIAEPRDCTTKDDLTQFLLDTQPPTVNPQAIAANGLPGATSSIASISSSVAPPSAMSRQSSLASTTGGDARDDGENTAPLASPTHPVSVAAPPAAAPSSWASLAGSRGPASSPAHAAAAVPSPAASPQLGSSAEVLNPDGIIYIVPPHLRAQSNSSSGSGSTNAPTPSSAGAIRKQSGTSGARPILQSTASIQDVRATSLAQEDVEVPDSQDQEDLERLQEMDQQQQQDEEDGLPQSTGRLAVNSDDHDLSLMSNSSAAPFGLPLTSPTLLQSLPSPAASPLNHRAPPGFGGFGMAGAGGPPPPGMGGPTQGGVGGGPPPGMGSIVPGLGNLIPGVTMMKMPSIVPPAISQLQAPPGHPSLHKGPPGMNIAQHQSPPQTQQQQQQQQQHQTDDEKQLAMLATAFPALNPAMLKLMMINHNMLAAQQPQHATQPPQQQQHQAQGYSSQGGPLSHAPSPSNNMQLQQQQHQQSTEPYYSQSHSSLSVHGPSSSHSQAPAGFGGFGRSDVSRDQSHASGPHSGYISQQLSPSRNSTGSANGSQHTNQQQHPDDWEALANDDDLAHDEQTSADTWSNWGARLVAASEHKRVLQDPHHHQQQQHSGQPALGHLSHQDERSHMMRSDQLSRDAAYRAQREREQMHARPPQPRDMWSSHPPQQQQQSSQHLSQATWQQEAPLGVSSLNLHSHNTATAAPLAQPTSGGGTVRGGSASRWGFSLDDGEDLAGSSSTGGSLSSSALRSFQPPLLRSSSGSLDVAGGWKETTPQRSGPPGISGLSAFGASSSSGWQPQHQQGGGWSQRDREPPSDDFIGMGNGGGGLHSYGGGSSFNENGLASQQQAPSSQSQYGGPSSSQSSGPRARPPLSSGLRQPAR